MELRLLALLCLVGAAFAGPFQRETGSRCSRHCSKKSHYNFEYVIGKTYGYEYTAENYITVAGTKKQKAVAEGRAEITFSSRCNGLLRMKNLRIQQKISSSEVFELNSHLEIPVEFAFEDGKIVDVCPSPRDTKQSLNIKKGLLSAMITTMDDLHTPQDVKEHDSLGNCMTKYTVLKTDGPVVQKVKDLKSCTNRHSSVTSWITTPYEAPNAKINTLPIFPDEHLVCVQSFKNKKLQKSVCKEHAKIKPMKARESVIQFDGKIELNLVEEKTSDIEPLEQSNGPESIMYNLEEQKDTRALRREAEKLLREICSKNNGVMDISVSKQFIELVAIVKHLPYADSDQIQKSLKNGDICKSKKVWDLFVDTLPMAGSDDAIKLLVHLIEKKEVTGVKANMWPASLAFIPNPTKETISNIRPLMKMVDSPAVLLGVSAMVNRFCSRENCDSIPEVQKITDDLENHMSKRRRTDDHVLAVLKAFGNMGYHGKAERKILALAKDRSKPMRLRLAAVDAFRRVEKKRPDEILQLFLNTKENYELRIASFASVMRHAVKEQLDEIKTAIEKESNDQVLGYAVSYIKNVNTTSCPLKRNIKKLLQNLEVEPPRKVSFWDHSKNFELSLHSEALNAGFTAEGDVIHHEDSKIPQRTTAKVDVEAFGHSVNLFELGMRLEGIIELLEKLVDLKHKIPKMSSLESSIKDIWRQSDADISVFFRTMGVEVAGYSASDLSTLSEVVKIAEMINKLSHERKADFSHSFLFLNTHLVIPSVTGRTYTLGLTGSTTVALTASVKLDLLGFPRSTDTHLSFQPSANVEIAATVGIQSSQQRPDIKLISSMHAEANVEARGQIQEGRIVKTSVSLPSENVMLVKYSTDVVEIDADHNEKRVFEKMQTKIDYCFDKLEKPLGISVCGKWNVPYPFVSKSFPFISGVGNVEVSIKKTDPSFSSYELLIEMPKHHSHHMKYIASLDTPGSKHNRRCAVEVDVNHRSKGHSDFKLEVTSPFGGAGGSGSLTRRRDLLAGSIELHSGPTSLLSVNASTSISESRARIVYKPRMHASFLKFHPLDVQGSIAITKGRKQQISIDLRSNKPRSKPMAIKGTILSEGKFGISKRSEWKVSSDVNIETPLIDARVRKTIEKRIDPINKLSSSLSVDYQIRNMRKESFKLSGSAQKSSSKINTILRSESTQYPQLNVDARWDRLGESGSVLKNDVTIKYGRNPENTYIALKHQSHAPSSGPKMCEISVKAPQFDIDSEVVFRHSLQTGDLPKVHFEVEARHKGDKVVKGLVSFDLESKHPLKARTVAELECPGGKLSLRDEIEETPKHHLKGKTIVQWREDKSIELEYRYKKLNAPDHHYELESSLRTPFLPRPIRSKVTIRLDDKSLSFDGQLSVQRDQDFVLEVLLNKIGQSRIVLRAPQAEGQVKVRNEAEKKSIEWGLKLKTNSRKSREIAGSASMNLENGKKFHVELLTDARRPQNKISASAELLTTKGDVVDTFKSNLKVQVFDRVSLSVSESGENSLAGRYESIIKASMKNHQPIEIKYEHNLSKKHVKSVVTVSRNNVQKAQIEIEGSLNEKANAKEISARAALKSLDNSFESKEVSMRHELIKSGSSGKLQSVMKYQHSPSKVYEAQWNSGLQPNGLELKAEVNTPLENYKKQGLGVTLQRSDRAVLSSITIEMPNNRAISMSADVQTKSRGLVANWKAKTPFDIVRDVKIHFSVDNEVDNKKISSFVDVNSARIADIEGSLTKSNGLEVQGEMKIAPIPNVSFQGVSFNLKQSSSLQSFSGKVALANSKHISVDTEIKEDGESISAMVSYSTPFSSVKDGKVQISVSNANQSPKKNLVFSIYVNQARIAYVEASIDRSSGLELKGQMKIAPIPNVSCQGVSFVLQKSQSSQSFSGKIDLINNRQISVNTEIKEEGGKISAMASYSTPYSQVKDGKVFISVSNLEQSSEKSLLFYVDSNGERKGDIEFSITCSSESVDIKGRLKTSLTPEVSAHLTVENRGESHSVSGKVLKGTSPLWSAVVSKQKHEKGEKLIVKTESFEKTMLDLQVSNEVSEDGVKLRAKASGRFSPVSLSVSSSRSEKGSVRMEISACQASSNSRCYTLKAYHKTMTNSENYHNYEKLTLDLEKSTGDSQAEQVGSAHLLLATSEHDYRSKIVFQCLEKKIGYELRIHRREQENERCSLDLSVMMPDRTSLIKGSILHSSNSMLLEVEAVPNEANPNRKCSLEMKREVNPRSNEVSGHIKMLGPDMTKPILLKGKVEKRGLLPVRGKVELHYSRTSWFKVLTLEMVPEKKRSGMESVLYRLYREDESVDVSLKLKKQKSRDEDIYGCDWKYKLNTVEKKGGWSMTVSKTRSGKPETIEISYYAPNVDLKIQGKSQWNANAPSETGVKVMSRGRVIKEIRILSKESCLIFEVERSGPFFKSSLCVNKHNGKSLQLVSIDATYRQRKCLDVRVGVDPTTPSFLDVVLEWKREDLITALSELTGLKSILNGRSLRELTRDLIEKTERIIENLRHHLRDIQRDLKELKERIHHQFRQALKSQRRMLKQHIEKMQSLKDSVIAHIWNLIPWDYIEKEFIAPLRSTIQCLIDGYTKLVTGHIPDVAKLIWNITRRQFEQCLRKFCTPGTFCHVFLNSYELHGFTHTRKLIQKRIDDVKRDVKDRLVKFWYPKFLSPWRLIRIGIKLAFKSVKLAVRIAIKQILAPILTPIKIIKHVVSLVRNVVSLVNTILDQVFGKFIARIIIKRLSHFVHKLEDLVRQKAIDVVDYVIHKINDWLLRAEKDEDFRTAMALVKEAKEKVIRTWRDRVEIIKKFLEPLEENITQNVKKAIDERFELKKYDPTEGEIRFRLRNPLGPAQMEVLKNMINMWRQKYNL